MVIIFSVNKRRPPSRFSRIWRRRETYQIKKIGVPLGERKNFQQKFPSASKEVLRHSLHSIIIVNLAHHQKNIEKLVKRRILHEFVIEPDLTNAQSAVTRRSPIIILVPHHHQILQKLHCHHISLKIYIFKNIDISQLIQTGLWIQSDCDSTGDVLCFLQVCK